MMMMLKLIVMTMTAMLVSAPKRKMLSILKPATVR
ncbi:unnamed protein product [Enterobius vermicularis]|uniref:Secreted protein n=1 Tax=Enterobius vermicularis TaxID=51028 RepID=A0A0N4VQB9_ENTVE|nr:unnamed protein product [Enterobius vermicularis]